MPSLPEARYAKEWEQTQIQRFNSILSRDISMLLRESSTEFNFLEIKEKLSNVLNQVSTISYNYDFWNELSENMRVNLGNALDDMSTVFNIMEQFDPKQNNAWELRNNIIQDFNNRYNGFYENVVAPLNSYLGRKAYSKELTSKFGQEAKKELSEIRRVRSVIENLQSEVSKAAGVAGDVASAAHAVSFSTQASEHKGFAKYWLFAVVSVMTVSLAVAMTVVIDIVRELRDVDNSLSVESGIIKLAILAFFYIVIRFTIRNYSAHQHLYIVNKQRANVLQSVEAFRSSVTTEEAKNTVLLAAVGAAYSQQESGFITTKEGAGTEDTDLMKVVESAIKKQ